MDSLTVVIQLTGLLMMVPHNAGAGSSMHALMPVTPDSIPHTAFIGFRKNSSTRRCDRDFQQFCLVRMDGWSLEPLPGGQGAPSGGNATLPRGAVNLSRGAGGRPVNPGNLGQSSASSTLRSRITLRTGGITDACNLALWEYDPAGYPPAVILPMPNVLEWTIPGVALDSIILVRHPINGGAPDTITTLHPDASGLVELLVAHVPPAGQGMLEEDLSLLRRRSIGRVPMEVARDPAGERSNALISDTNSRHLHAAYNLLVNAQDRPLPTHRETLIPHSCRMMIWHEYEIRSPTTVNCMVTSGTS